MNAQNDLVGYQQGTYFKDRTSLISQTSEKDKVGDDTLYVEDRGGPIKGAMIGLAIMLPVYTSIIGLFVWLTHR